MEIPFKQLSADALKGVIEEYISREGTDYGEREFSFEQKVEQVKSQLDSGEVILQFDPETETCNLARKD